MPIRVLIGDGSRVAEFPDDMPHDQIVGELQRKFGSADAELRSQQRIDIKSELSPESMAKFQAEQEAQWNQDNPSSIPEGPRRLAAGALRLIEAPLRLGAEYKAVTPVMWIPGVADASKAAADRLNETSRMLVPESTGINDTAKSWSDVTETYEKAGPLAGAAALGELGVGAVLDNLPQLVPGAMAAKWLQGAGLTAKAASRIAPLIATAPLETADALKEYQAAGADPLRAKLLAPVVGAVNAALETVGDSALLERAFMPEAKQAAKFIFGQFLKEATTETAQEAVTMAGRVPAGAAPVSQEEAIDRLLTAGIAGGFAGAGTSGAIEAGRRMSEPAQREPLPPPPPSNVQQDQQVQAPVVPAQQPPPANIFEAITQGNAAIIESTKRLQAPKIETPAINVESSATVAPPAPASVVAQQPAATPQQDDPDADLRALADTLESRLKAGEFSNQTIQPQPQPEGVPDAQRQEGRQETLLKPTQNFGSWNEIDSSTPEDLAPEGSLRLSEVLPSIDQSDNEVHRAVSTRLRELNIDMPIRVVSREKFEAEFGGSRPSGAYRYDTGEIVLQQRSAGSANTVVHEAVHGAISKSIDDDAFRGQVLKLRSDAIAVVGDKFYGTKDHGSDWSNAQEFVADVSGSPDLQAALRSIKVGDTKTTLWQRFVEIVRKLFGLKPSQTNMLDKVLSVTLPAMSQPGTAQKPASFAPELYKNAEQARIELSRPGISPEGARAVEQRASAQAAMIPEPVVRDVEKLSTPDPALTKYDNKIRKRTGQIVSWLVDQFNAWPTRNSVRSLPATTEEEHNARGAVAGGMLKLDAHLRNQIERLDTGTLERVLPAMDKARASIEKARTLGLRASLIRSMRERMADEFGEYIDASAQVGSNLATSEVDALRKATDRLANVRRKIGIEPSEVDKALSHIAYQIPQAVLANLQTPSDVLNYVVQNNVFGNAQDIPADTVDFLTYKVGTQRRAPLESFSGLIPALKRIQKITDEKQAAELTVERFEKKWADIHNRVRRADGKAKAVALQDFLTQYRRLLNEEAESAEISKDLSRKFERLDIELRAREAAKQIYARTISDPGYQSELRAAEDILEVEDPALSQQKSQLRGMENTDDQVRRFMVGGEVFDISWSLAPGSEEKNLETVAQMLRAIDEQLADPRLHATARRTYENLKSYANAWLNHIGNSEQFGGLRMNSLDFVNKLRARLAVMLPFMTRDFVVRMMPGRLRADLLSMASATNALRKALDQVTLHPTFGRMKLTLAVDNAIKSHPGLSKKDWESDVFNYVIDSGQDVIGAKYEVGDMIPETGHKVTKEDLEAARINSKFASAAYKAVEGASGMSGVLASNPQLIEADDTRLLRKGIKAGPYVAPRTRNRGVANDPARDSADSMLKAWREEGSQKLAEQDWFFRKVVLSHVVTSNPEFVRGSQFEQAYQQLGHEYRKQLRETPETIEALVGDIVELVEIPEDVTVEQMVKRVRDTLLTEVDNKLKSFDDNLNGRDDASKRRQAEDLNGLGVTGLTRKEEQDKLLNKESIVHVLDSQSSFTTERGKMLAPPAFYKYSLASNAATGALLKAAIMPFHRRELQLLKASVTAIETEKKRLKDMVESGVVTNKQIRADVQSGKLYADISQLDLMGSLLGGMGDLYKESVMSSASHANRDPNLLETWLGVDRSLLLATPTSLTSNMINAMSAGNVVPYWMMGMKGKALRNSAMLLGTNAYNIAIRSTAGTDVGKWLMANRKRLMPGLRHIAQHMERATVAAMVAKASAVAPDRLRYNERVNAIKQLGTLSGESPVLGYGQDMTKTRKISQFLAKVPGMPEAAAFVNDLTRLTDQYGNITSIDNSMEALRALFLATYKVMESRSRSGVPGWNDWSNPDNAIKPAELKVIGFGDESMALVRQILAPAGGFERAAYDFWMRTRAMDKSDRAVAMPIENQGALHDVLDQLLGFINLPLISNRPDVLRGETWLGRVLKSMTTFPGWISMWIGTLGTMVSTSTKKPVLNRVAFGAVSIALVALLMAFIGMSAIEPRRLVYENMIGRTFPTLTPRSLLTDMTPSTAAKVLGASIASSIPYIGEVAADILGAPTYRSSATDLTSMSRTLSLATDLKSAFEYGFKTGDTIGMLGQVARTAAPIGSMLWNRIPAFAERNAVADATRAARVAAGPLEVVETAGRGGGGGEPSRFSTLIRRAVAAEIGGDPQYAQAMIAEARAEKAREGSTDPDTAIKAALASQMPDRKAFGRTLEDSEEAALIRRMSGRQKFAYAAGRQAVANLLSGMPTKVKKTKRSKGMSGLKLGNMKLKTPKLKMATARSATSRPQVRWPSLGQGLSLRL